MPAVRFSRDKRGYEYVSLVYTQSRRGKPGRSRVLYWYRTPPGVRVGRKPFDPEMQRALEGQNPGVAFDWEAIIATPVPPPDMTEFWRERRRAEKVARQERRAMEAEDVAPGDEPPTEDAGVGSETSDLDAMTGALDPVAVASAVSAEPDEADAAALSAVADSVTGVAEAEGQTLKKRRRRRGGRRRRDVPSSGNGAVDTGDAIASGASPAQSEREDPESEGE